MYRESYKCAISGREHVPLEMAHIVPRTIDPETLKMICAILKIDPERIAASLNAVTNGWMLEKPLSQAWERGAMHVNDMMELKARGREYKHYERKLAFDNYGGAEAPPGQIFFTIHRLLTDKKPRIRAMPQVLEGEKSTRHD